MITRRGEVARVWEAKYHRIGRKETTGRVLAKKAVVKERKKERIGKKVGVREKKYTRDIGDQGSQLILPAMSLASSFFSSSSSSLVSNPPFSFCIPFFHARHKTRKDPLGTLPRFSKVSERDPRSTGYTCNLHPYNLSPISYFFLPMRVRGM